MGGSAVSLVVLVGGERIRYYGHQEKEETQKGFDNS